MGPSIYYISTVDLGVLYTKYLYFLGFPMRYAGNEKPQVFHYTRLPGYAACIKNSFFRVHKEKGPKL